MEKDLQRFLNGDKVNATMMIEAAPEQRWIEITPRPEARKKGWFRRLMPFAVLVALVAIIYSAVSMERVASAPEVPALEGRVLQDARDRLDPLGVQVRIIFEYSSEPTNVVLEQAPPTGTSIRAGETVILTVSKGPEPSFFEEFGGGIQDAFSNGLGRGIEEYLRFFGGG